MKHFYKTASRRHISSVLNGTTATQIDENEIAIPVTRIETISNGSIDLDRIGYVSPGIELERYKLRRGDLLFSHINSLPMIGNCAIYNEDYPLYVGMNLLRIRPTKETESRFLFYCFRSDYGRYQVRTFAKPAINQASISTTNLKRVLLPFTDFETQKAIADFLDRETGRIDQLIEKKQRLAELLKDKRAALISHAVTKGLDPNAKMKSSGIEWLGEIPEHWEVLHLRRLVKSVKTGGTPSGAEEHYYEESGYNWHTPGDFSDDIYLGNSERTLSELGREEVRLFPPMTVMMVGIGATIGKVGLSQRESSCNQQINGIVCNDKLNAIFATYYLKTVRDLILKCGKYTTMPIINQEETKSLIITAPPIKEQQAITAFLDGETSRIDTLIEKINLSVEKLKEFRSAIITAAVTGQIDVATWGKRGDTDRRLDTIEEEMGA